MTCTNVIGSYICSCLHKLKLSLNGKTCEDKHECEIDNGGCGVSEVCINSYGGHYCVTAGATAVSAASTNEQSLLTDDLLNRDVILGLLIWLIILSVIVLSLLICLCVNKYRSARERKLLRKYTTDSLRSASRYDDRICY
ncbi:hypothetical protein LSAT2_032685 [Lamellibrachia satsuma]|nr:hypothetical protein LSAT2_032685 [Lamellibrachia satsuma]